MKIVFDLPPIYDEIKAVFPTANRSVIFAWGDTIYNPGGVTIGPELIAHEQVHGSRQGNDILGWWEQYIHDREFRLTEETLAHIAEMEFLFGPSPNRQMKRRILRATAKRLANPLYRHGITRARAEELLKEAL